MYVAVKGGEAAISAAHRLFAARRRGDPSVPALSVEQIAEQLHYAVDRAMAEGSLYDRGLASLAIKQAAGELIEAVFLLRAYRNTLPRFGYSDPVDTAQMRIDRRISATFKDLPGGQRLGPTFDYSHRLLEFALAAEGEEVEVPERRSSEGHPPPHVAELLRAEGLMEPDRDSDPGTPVGDLTREPLDFPLGRDVRLQALARGDEGYLLALAYSTQRGFGRNHPFAGEIRIGAVEVVFDVPELGFALVLGEITVTECQMINQFTGSAQAAPQFTRGYGLVFGHAERKAMAMSLVDRALRADEFDEPRLAPAQDEEFVIYHCDNIQASGFVEHLKLPHYVDFQAELDLIRRLRRTSSDALARDDDGATPRDPAAMEAAQ